MSLQKHTYVCKIKFILYVHMCMYACVCVCVKVRGYDSSTLWVWGIELRSSGVVASVFTNRTILPTHKHVFLKLYWKTRYSKWQISHPNPEKKKSIIIELQSFYRKQSRQPLQSSLHNRSFIRFVPGPGRYLTR